MKRIHLVLAVASLVFAAGAVAAPFVQGNEAVSSTPDGLSRIETPPLPATGPVRRSKPCLADAGCHAGAWHMVETTEGLRECTEAYTRAGTCRASSYGDVKLSRLWIVKSNGRWLQCQFPDLDSKCVDMFAPPPSNLPFDAVQ